MGITEIITLIIYMMSMFGLSTYFDLYYMFSIEFAWKVISITLASWGPLHIASILKDRFDPTDAKRVSG